MFHHMYTAPCRGSQSIGDKIKMTTERQKGLLSLPICCKFHSSKSDFMHIFNDFIHVYSPEARAENPLGTNFWRQEKALITSTICCKFQTNLFEFWFYTHFLMFFHMYTAPGQGQTTLCGQNPNVNRKALLVTLPNCCKFQKDIFGLILYIIFNVFIHVYSPAQGQTTPWGQNFYINIKPFVTLVICCKFLPLNDFLTVFPI